MLGGHVFVTRATPGATPGVTDTVENKLNLIHYGTNNARNELRYCLYIPSKHKTCV